MAEGVQAESREPRPTGVRELGGDLPCARCSYSLRGLSIRGVCPECATPIRATLLARLDPHAGELQPIAHPRVVATGLAFWGLAPLIAALILWTLRLADLFDVPGLSILGGLRQWGGEVAVAAMALSGLGAIVLIRPHGGPQARAGMLAAIIGVCSYVPLVYAAYRVHVGFDRLSLTGPYGDEAAHDEGRLGFHMLSAGAAAAIAVLTRPNARLLAARSLLMRSGRVDRQTLRAVAAVLGVVVVGDGLRWIGWSIPGGTGVLIDQAGQALVLVGSVLFTVGLAGIAVDCARLVPVILEPPLTLARVLAPSGPTGRPTP